MDWCIVGLNVSHGTTESDFHLTIDSRHAVSPSLVLHFLMKDSQTYCT